MPVFDLAPLGAITAASVGVLVTGLLLGFRHGFDWDHIAAITDITSTSAAADAGVDLHDARHASAPHEHAHGGPSELAVHDARGGAARPAHDTPGAMLAVPELGDGAIALAATPALGALPLRRSRLLHEQRHAILLGTLYALGHATVVFILGLLALAFGAVLPSWVDPIMSRVVGLTLLLLGIWVFVSLVQYLRNGTQFRLRSRWMLVFDGIRYGWRRLQAKLHGHEHVAPLEMSSYGRRTAYGVGMIHGIGAETGSQALLIAAVGGAAGAGLGIPMLVAFIIGLLASNTLVVVVSATGFVAGQARQRLYVAIGVLAGSFSVVVGLTFLLGAESFLPDLQRVIFGAS